MELTSAGHIVDPSPRFCEGQAGVLRYFPAQRWTSKKVQRLMRQYRDEVELPLYRHHVQCVNGRRVTVAAEITQGWRRAIEDCHDFRVTLHREAGSPIAATADDERRMLEHELGAWPLPRSDEEAF